MHELRQRCRAGEVLIGTFSAIPHPVAVEVAAQAGLDFVCIDWEHSQIGRERIEDMIRAADVNSVPAMVRVPGHGPEAIAAALDAGAAGVLVPRVNTVEQALAAVQATRYPPSGSRGVGPGRAAAYGYQIAKSIGRANQSTLLALQVETAEGLANIAGIAAVQEVDLIFIGPGDLSVSIDAMGPAGAERLDAAINQIIRSSQDAGRKVGIFRPSSDDVGRYAGLGVSFFILSSDAMALGAALSQSLQAALQALDGKDPDEII